MSISSKIGAQRTADAPPALPLWIRGRPHLVMSERLLDVVRPGDGRILRRVPLCGREETADCLQACVDVAHEWAGRGEVATILADTAQRVQRYSTHLAGILQDETGGSLEDALGEVQKTVEILSQGPVCRNRQQDDGAYVIFSDASQPLLSLTTLLAPVLRANRTAVIKPSVLAPSVAMALCEILTRAGLPPGVCNLLHGDYDVVEALGKDERTSFIFAIADTALSEKLKPMLRRPYRFWANADEAQANESNFLISE